MEEESERGRQGTTGKISLIEKEAVRCMLKIEKISGGGSCVCIVIQ